MPNKELEEKLGIKVSDEKLKLNKRLPYIKLPKEKVNLFIDWYNQDLRTIKDIPRVFEEGYIEIDISDMVKTKTFSIFEIQNDKDYENIKKLNIEDQFNKIAKYLVLNTVNEKYIMDVKYVSPFAVVGLEGIGGLVSMTIIYPILAVFNKEFDFDHLKDYMKFMKFIFCKNPCIWIYYIILIIFSFVLYV